jgi:hypothetical protein
MDVRTNQTTYNSENSESENSYPLGGSDILETLGVSAPTQSGSFLYSNGKITVNTYLTNSSMGTAASGSSNVSDWMDPSFIGFHIYVKPSVLSNPNWTFLDANTKKDGLMVKVTNSLSNQILFGYLYTLNDDIVYFERLNERKHMDFYFEMAGDIYIDTSFDENERSSVLGSCMKIGVKSTNPPVSKSRQLFIKNASADNYYPGLSSEFEGSELFQEMYLKQQTRQIPTLSELLQTGSKRLQPPIIELVLNYPPNTISTIVVKGQIYKTENGPESTVWFKFSDEYVGYDDDLTEELYVDVGSIESDPYEIDYVPFKVKNKTDKGQEIGFFAADPTYFGNDGAVAVDANKDAARWENSNSPILQHYFTFVRDKTLLNYEDRFYGPLVSLSIISSEDDQTLVEKVGYISKYNKIVYFTLKNNSVGYFPENTLVDIKLAGPFNFFKIDSDKINLRKPTYLRELSGVYAYKFYVKLKDESEFTSLASDWNLQYKTESDVYLSFTNNIFYEIDSDGSVPGPKLTINNNSNNKSNKLKLKGQVIKYRASFYNPYEMFFVPENQDILITSTSVYMSNIEKSFQSSGSKKGENRGIERKNRKNFVLPAQQWFNKKKGGLKVWIWIVLVLVFGIPLLFAIYRYFKKTPVDNLETAESRFLDATKNIYESPHTARDPPLGSLGSLGSPESVPAKKNIFEASKNSAKATLSAFEKKANNVGSVASSAASSVSSASNLAASSASSAARSASSAARSAVGRL